MNTEFCTFWNWIIFKLFPAYVLGMFDVLFKVGSFLGRSLLLAHSVSWLGTSGFGQLVERVKWVKHGPQDAKLNACFATHQHWFGVCVWWVVSWWHSYMWCAHRDGRWQKWKRTRSFISVVVRLRWKLRMEKRCRPLYRSERYARPV